MNLAHVARLLGGFTLFFTAIALVPLAVALGEPASDYDTTLGFGVTAVAGAVISGSLRCCGIRCSDEFFRREGLAVVGLSWVVAGILGALPFLISGTIPGVIDSIFESISGLTTTGATVLGCADNPTIESLPPSVLLWRSILQWIGGTGVILLFTVLLPAMGVTGKNLLDGEAVGLAREDQKPRMQEQARALFRLYLGLSAAAFLAYLAAGLGAFDALCHAFTTMATGGFSTRNASMGSFENVAAEVVATLFMFLAGCNFAMLLGTLRSNFDLKHLWNNIEFRFYLGVTLSFIALVTISLRTWGQQVPDPVVGGSQDYGSLFTCLRYASFQVTSMMTSTGFSTCDFQNWPKVPIFVLLACMLVGGSAGSTAGGFKIIRALVCSKLVGYSIRLFVRPRSVQKMRIGDELLPNSVVSAVLTMLILWLCFIGLGTLVLAIDSRIDPVAALSTSFSMMGCTGPALTQVVPTTTGFETALDGAINVGPYGGYAELHGYAKLYLSLQMILGRLEILAPLVLLIPRFWRKA